MVTSSDLYNLESLRSRQESATPSAAPLSVGLEYLQVSEKVYSIPILLEFFIVLAHLPLKSGEKDHPPITKRSKFGKSTKRMYLKSRKHKSGHVCA